VNPFPRQPGDQLPAEQDRQPGAGIADQQRRLDHLSGDLQRGPAALDGYPVPVGELDLLLRILQPRGHQQRTLAGQQRPLCDPGGTVGAAILAARSALRADRFAERTDANVATASTKVPPAVASEATVVQSVIAVA
jgi:hypothetical protein